MAELKKELPPIAAEPGPPARRKLSLELRKELTSRRDQILGAGPGTLFETSSGISIAFCAAPSGSPEICCLTLGQALDPVRKITLLGSPSLPLACSAASLASGRVLLVFTDGRARDGTSPVFGCVFSPASRESFAPLSWSESPVAADGPRVTATRSGDAVTAWHQFGGNELRTIVSWWNPNRSAPCFVSIPDAAFPSIALFEGRTLCAVHEVTATGRALRLYSFESAGRPPAEIDLPGLSRPAFPVLAALPDGRAGVLFWDLAPSPSIMFLRLSRDGQPEGEPILLGDASTPPRCPALVAVPGGFVAAWAGKALAPDRFPLFATFLPEGLSAPPPSLILDEGNVSHPALLLSPHGLFAAWRKVTPAGSGILAARLTLEAS